MEKFVVSFKSGIVEFKNTNYHNYSPINSRSGKGTTVMWATLNHVFDVVGKDGLSGAAHLTCVNEEPSKRSVLCVKSAILT